MSETVAESISSAKSYVASLRVQLKMLLHRQEELKRKIYDAECDYIKKRWCIQAGTIIIDDDGSEMMVAEPNIVFYEHSQPTVSARKRNKNGTWSDRTYHVYSDRYTVKASVGHA